MHHKHYVSSLNSFYFLTIIVIEMFDIQKHKL